MRIVTPLLAAITGALSPLPAAEGEKAKPAKQPKPVAGKADLLRHVPKKFATFEAWDTDAQELRLLVEGDDAATTWPLQADAECKIDGWWGRPEQLQAGERVWVWFAIDRSKKPRAILMIADAGSELDIHNAMPEERRDEFEGQRAEQRDWLRSRWREEGLPGSVSFTHALGGEADLMLDHEAIRWGRFLKPGDAVEIVVAGAKLEAKVKSVRPWRERTLLRIVPKSGLDLLDLGPGERIHLRVPEPPADIQNSDLPTDIGRLDDRGERIDWFLSTIYCTCAIAGDRCTGMFYTQASCNVNGCGMPKQIAGKIGALIDEGKSDEEIFLKFKKERGAEWWRPHLLK